jgi:uncharacterized short protein YbdD (DUF466 family)
MICNCFGKTFDTTALANAARLMLGVPPYETYLQHVASTHPGQIPMTQGEFMQNRTNARFGAGGLRCC